MSTKYFIDTNILVYSFDPLSPKKRKLALSIIETGLVNGEAAISWQVVQEFLNVATSKFNVPLSDSDARLYFSKVLKPLCRQQSQSDLYLKALTLKSKLKYSFYDCLILASALSLESQFLYSEDFQHGQQIESLQIINPFL